MWNGFHPAGLASRLVDGHRLLPEVVPYLPTFGASPQQGFKGIAMDCRGKQNTWDSLFLTDPSSDYTNPSRRTEQCRQERPRLGAPYPIFGLVKAR